ncbi:Uncharacterized protein Rs2_51801 [Raphanus sativus]|nr:Uncharacterized protein Rs2_51801 [Raphanus sativus]
MHAFLWWWSAVGFPENGGSSTVLRRRMILGPCRFFVRRGRRLSILEEGFELFTKVFRVVGLEAVVVSLVPVDPVVMFRLVQQRRLRSERKWAIHDSGKASVAIPAVTTDSFGDDDASYADTCPCVVWLQHVGLAVGKV